MYDAEPPKKSLEELQQDIVVWIAASICDVALWSNLNSAVHLQPLQVRINQR
jgi:hypothetical protein